MNNFQRTQITTIHHFLIRIRIDCIPFCQGAADRPLAGY
jgi:hypothetical protein